MLETLKTLCSLPGASGREDAVREYLIRRVNPHAEYEVDALGNLLVHKKGAQRAKKKVMLAAHMDEVALIVTYITEDGYLKFSPVVGIEYDERIYENAQKNKETAVSSGRVSFEKVDATEFVVPDQADRMYFFNPFSVEILQHVIARILESYYRNMRPIQLFFY